MQSSVPVIDLAPWLGGDGQARAGVAAQVDAALRSAGFFLITGHGVPGDLPARVRAQARAFFALPREAKQRYAVTVGGRGWLPPGVEANGYAEGTATPPDLKESFAVGADQPTGDPDVGTGSSPMPTRPRCRHCSPPWSPTWPGCASSRTSCSRRAPRRWGWRVISSPGTRGTPRTR